MSSQVDLELKSIVADIEERQKMPSEKSPPVTLEDVKAGFEKWLYLEDKNVIDVVLATVVGNKMPTENVWLLLTGSSGSAKTEILRALSGEGIFTISTLTGQTLVSGFRNKGKDPSILPLLNNKTLIIKDFTSVLSLHKDERSKVFADLRDSYDGNFTKGFGNEAGVTRYESKYGIIGGVTPEIDKYHSVTNVLGERFLKYRPILKDRSKAIERSKQNRGKEKEMRSELRDLCLNFLTPFDVTKEVSIPKDIDEQIESLAEWVAILRTEVSRDGYTKEIMYLPEIEIGTRLVKQLTTLAISLAMIRGKNEVSSEEFMVLGKVARDTLSSRRMILFEALFTQQEFLNTQGFSNITNLPTESCKMLLDDFRLLGIVERQGEHEFEWRLKDNLRSQFLKAGL